MSKKLVISGAWAAVDAALRQGVALHTAVVRKDDKIYLHFKVTTWDNRCKSCMPDNETKENVTNGT